MWSETARGERQRVERGHAQTEAACGGCAMS